MELYALRLLLLNTPGPTGYDYLKTVYNGPKNEKEICPTFAKAAEKRGLLDSDENWKDVMQDAINASMSVRKRISHFAQLLFFQPPVDPEQMLEDFIDQLIAQPPNAQDEAVSRKIRKEIILCKLEYYLSKFGSSCVYENILY